MRGEFGYWVFEGDWQAAQRPSLELPRRGRRRHRRSTCSRTGTTCWRTCSAGCEAVTARAATHIPERRGRAGPAATRATADDAAYGDLRAGRRDRRPDQLLLVRPGEPRRAGGVPGRRHEGSAVAGLRDCRIQHRAATPQAGLEPRPAAPPSASAASGRRCRTTTEFDNGFKVQWELFLRHVVGGRRRSRGTSWPARAASSWPSWACAPRPRAPAGRVPELEP